MLMTEESFDGVIYSSIDKYIEKYSRRAKPDEFFAVLCASGSDFRCTYFAEYACYFVGNTNLIMGLIDCVAGEYFVSKALQDTDLASAKKEPFKIILKDTAYDFNTS